MNTNTNKTLEFNIILEKLSCFAVSNEAKEKLLLLKPFLSESECKLKMNETSEAVKIIEYLGTPPLSSMEELNKILNLTEKGAMLIPEQLTGILGFISSCKRMKSYLKKTEILDINIAFYGGAIYELDNLFEEIDRSIRNGAVEDNASNSLRDMRRKIENCSMSINAKLQSILRVKKELFTDGYIANRNGHLVLPVKKECKNQVSGTVIDTSSTGSTLFIEPTAVRKLQEELSLLQIDEENEVRKVLYTLTALVYEYLGNIRTNMECMVTLDFVFAKAKLSLEMNGIAVTVTVNRKIIIKQGRHPLLKQDLCVPLDFEIGDDINGVVVTGPNTGGKTVSLKTVGLLSIMAQCGLHVPVSQGSIFCMHSNVLCDIGDGQSIAENLSTFSAHIRNIISILENVSNESLVLLDELGSGTDPAEGMGIAIAILDELIRKGCLFVATTHYPEIKDFATKTEKIINARMEFDRESLQPLYKLQIGEAGESCALYIAKTLGFPEHMLKRAHSEAYGVSHSSNRIIPEMIFSTSEENNVKKEKIIKSVIKKEIVKKISNNRCEMFNMGDSVMIYPNKEIGIIYTVSNEKGEIGVQIKGKKQVINHKRIKLITAASELYPDDYDFSIIFDGVEDRKAKHEMSRKYSSDLEIIYTDGK